MRSASLIIGVLGGVGSGKSTVTELLAELGAESLDADLIAHQILEEDDVRQKLRAWWGPTVFDAAGCVDRRAIAARVFASPAERARLEALVHPRVRARIESRVAAFRAGDIRTTKPRGSAASDAHESSARERLLVLDVSLLATSPLRPLCDELVFVDADDGARRERTRQRGWADGELERREAAQASLEEKRELATRVIENDAGLPDLRRKVEELHRSLTTSSTQGNE